MASSGMLRRVAVVRPDVSEERSASLIRMTRIGELGTTLAVTSNRRSVRRLLVTVTPQSLIQWVPGIKRQGRQADGSLLTSAKIMNTWVYTSATSYLTGTRIPVHRSSSP
jgi:hypothetical protein